MGSSGGRGPGILRLAVGAALVGSMVLLVASGSASARVRHLHEQVYVANADSGPVTAYPSHSRGAVSPDVTVPDPNLPGTYWDPWGVAFDNSGSLYVQSFLSDATTFVFGAGSSSPSRVFRADGPDTRAIAVDQSGFEYIASSEFSSVISVVAPGAAGSPNDLYTVSPVRSFTSDENGFHPWPDLLALDGQNDLVLAAARPGGNAVEVFQGGANGTSTPLRVIAGPHTDLGRCDSFDSCEHLSVAFSPVAGTLDVAVSSAAGTRVLVFDASASGDVTPKAVISGTKTGFDGKVITGISTSGRDGSIYTMVKGAQFGATGQIEVFSSSANGNHKPKRVFTDASSAFVDAEGISVH